MSQKTPRNFFKPLAIGAPDPMRELPIRLERMIHFVPPHLEKVRAKVPQMADQADVVLANLEDAIPADAKDAARDGAIEMGKMVDWQAKGTGFWSRVNPLNSPWFQDDVSRLVLETGDQLDVIMLPKVEGPWDIHFADQYVAQLEAKADPRDRAGHGAGRGDRAGLAAHAGHIAGPGRPCRGPQDEDDARGRRPSLLPCGR